jgi:hypothetical protein
MNINGMAALRNLLAEMEADLGLHELSGAQRDILYAASLMASKSEQVTSASLQQHPLLKNMTRSTLFRCLKALSDAGFLIPKADQSGCYEVCKGLSA